MRRLRYKLDHSFVNYMKETYNKKKKEKKTKGNTTAYEEKYILSNSHLKNASK